MLQGFRRSLQALYHRPLIIAGNFTTNGSSAPTLNSGKGVSVSRTGTGAYTITLSTPPYKPGSVVSIQLTVNHSAATFAIAGTVSGASFPLTVYDSSGTAADQGTVHFQIFVTESSQLQ